MGAGRKLLSPRQRWRASLTPARRARFRACAARLAMRIARRTSLRSYNLYALACSHLPHSLLANSVCLYAAWTRERGGARPLRRQARQKTLPAAPPGGCKPRFNAQKTAAARCGWAGMTPAFSLISQRTEGRDGAVCAEGGKVSSPPYYHHLLHSCHGQQPPLSPHLYHSTFYPHLHYPCPHPHPTTLCHCAWPFITWAVDDSLTCQPHDTVTTTHVHC